MMTNQDDFDLMVTLPAVELARLRRRIAFLEAAVIQTLRDDQTLREWFTASDLAALRLAGLPASKSGIARVAHEQGWTGRVERGRGGDRLLYHFASLPRRAFSDFIERVVMGAGAPADAAAMPPDAAMPLGTTADPFPALASPPSSAPSEGSEAPRATPQWVLPLLRLLKAGGGPLAHALAELSHHLAPGIGCPTLDEAREMLRQIGIAGT